MFDVDNDYVGDTKQKRKHRPPVRLAETAKASLLRQADTLPATIADPLKEALTALAEEMRGAPVRLDNLLAHFIAVIVPVVLVAGDVEIAKTNQRDTRRDLEAIIREKDVRHEVEKKEAVLRLGLETRNAK